MCSGAPVVSMEDTVVKALRSLSGIAKREDLCSQVAARTGISMAEVMANLSRTLKKMKEAGVITSPARGYWRLAA